MYKPSINCSENNNWASLMAQRLKCLPAMQETWVRSPGSGRFPWRRKWQPTPIFLPGESHGRRSLVGYSPWDRKESDTAERLHFHSQDAKSRNTCRGHTETGNVLTEVWVLTRKMKLARIRIGFKNVFVSRPCHKRRQK